MKFEIAPETTEVKLNWDDARMYCFALNIDGKTGWRLPTNEELNLIYESTNDFVEWYYWTSTEEYGYADCYWTRNMCNGLQYGTNTYGICYVRAIRDLKDN